MNQEPMLVRIDFQRPLTLEERVRYAAEAAECDSLAETEAVAKGKRHWGRWFLDDKEPISLNTAIIRPLRTGIHYNEDYEIELSRCKTRAGREIWIRHMAEKRWIGKRGLLDLWRAFDGLCEESFWAGTE